MSEHKAFATPLGLFCAFLLVDKNWVVMERDRDQNNEFSSLFSNSFSPHLFPQLRPPEATVQNISLFSQADMTDMAPLCRLAIYGSIGSYIIMSYPAARYLPLLKANTENIVLRRELWRLPLSKLCFTDLKQLTLCVILLLHFKKFEKRFGTRKFASYACCILVLTQAMEYLLLFGSYKAGFVMEDLPNGLLGVIFSLFIPFFLDIPRIERAHILGIPMTGKAIAYICGLQICSSSVETLCSSLIGIMGGALYRANFCFMKTHFLVPEQVSSIFYKLFSPIFGVSPPPTRKNYGATLELQRLEEEEKMEQALLMANMRAQRDRHEARGGLRSWLGGGRGRVAPPSEDMIRTLTNMGFNREQVAEALRMCNNDLAQATNYLLASNR